MMLDKIWEWMKIGVTVLLGTLLGAAALTLLFTLFILVIDFAMKLSGWVLG